MKKCIAISSIVILLLSFKTIPNHRCFEWGSFAHKKINRLAIFTLPEEMFGFYKANADYLTEHSVDADKRRHSIKGEAPKHYIDLDHYGGDSISDPQRLFDLMPRIWYDAVDKFSQDTLVLMQTYDWPGNIRQLKNVIEWLLIMYVNIENFIIKIIDFFLKKKNWRKAHKIAENAFSFCPNNRNLEIRIAGCCFHLNKIDEAIYLLNLNHMDKKDKNKFFFLFPELKNVVAKT